MADGARTDAGADAALADRSARERIRRELDRNLVVEAAAGAGKTHALVGRIVALVAAGRCSVEDVAAVTFTRKAAGELRGRLLARLEAAAEAEAAGQPGERARLEAALDGFERAFAGTIHAFCARLLRERPVEAGVDPGFSELDEREEEALLREAWDDYLDREGGGGGRLEAVEELGVVPEDLFPTFRRLARYPEVEVPREATPPPDLEKPARQVARFVRRALRRVPDEPVEDRYGKLQSTLFAARSFLRNRDLDTPAERARFLELFDGGTDPTLKLWGDPDTGREVREEMRRVSARWVEEPLRRWREHAYPVLLEFVEPAVGHYRRVRRRRGRLNFQDLLLRAAELLRGHPGVRRHFAERYTHVLVDEFQDTDPVQAEILFLLTGRDGEEDDWRRLRPRPGSLFLVGDPKQSIYRFRRADIDVYRFVRERIREGGGEVVTLTTSFRSTEPVVAWLNESLQPVFEERPEDVQPAFARLDPHREGSGAGPGGEDHGVRRLDHDKVPYNPAGEVAAVDARRIARWVRAAVDAPAPPGGLSGEPVSEGDVLILLRQKKHLSLYARALEREGLAYEVSGGGAVSESRELKALLDMARAALRPDDPVALAAFLRGPLAGVSDDALYRFRRAGGEWRYTAYAGDGSRAIPSGREADALEAAFGTLADAYRALQSLPPAAALEVLMDETGLLADAAGREAGSSRAGSLLKVLSMVRGWQAEGHEIARVLDEIEALSDDDAPGVDEMVLETGRADVVRVMNVHKAKGLQGRVVFLADPLKASPTRVEAHVERLDGGEPRGHFPFFRPTTWGPPGKPLALPPRWEELEAREEAYLEAEEDRLLYVAATRARDLLVVSRYPHSDRGPWTRLYPALEDVPELDEPGEATAPARPDARDADGEGGPREPGAPGTPASPGGGAPDEGAIARRWEAARVPSFEARTVTGEAAGPAGSGAGGAGSGRARAEEARPPDARGGDEERDGRAPVGRERARAFGTAVHEYLRRWAEGRVDDDGAVARLLLERVGAGPERVPEVLEAARRLRESRPGRAVRTADRVLCEVPLAVRTVDAGRVTVTRGVVDLAVRTPDGWLLADHKTHRIEEDELPELAERFRPQLEGYRRGWRRATGEDVAETGLFFTHVGRWWEVSG